MARWIKAVLLVLAGAVIAFLILRLIDTAPGMWNGQESENWEQTAEGGYYSKITRDERIFAGYKKDSNVMEIYITFPKISQYKIYKWTVPVDPSSDIDPDRESFWLDVVNSVKNDRKNAEIIKLKR